MSRRTWRGESPEVRDRAQRERLLRAAAAVVVESGVSAATAEAISRAAGMSKATFYAQFGNRDDCLQALFDLAAETALKEVVRRAREAGADSLVRQRAGLRAFLEVVSLEPVVSRAVLVEIMAAGPKTLARRDLVVAGFAEVMYRETARGAERTGGPRFADRRDAHAIAGAIIELVGYELRAGGAADILALEPVFERLLLGVLVDASTGG